MKEPDLKRRAGELMAALREPARTRPPEEGLRVLALPVERMI